MASARSDRTTAARVARPVAHQLMGSMGEYPSVKSAQTLVDRVILLRR